MQYIGSLSKRCYNQIQPVARCEPSWMKAAGCELRRASYARDVWGLPQTATPSTVRIVSDANMYQPNDHRDYLLLLSEPPCLQSSVALSSFSQPCALSRHKIPPPCVIQGSAGHVHFCVCSARGSQLLHMSRQIIP